MSTKLDSMMLESKSKSSNSSTFESLFCPSLIINHITCDLTGTGMTTPPRNFRGSSQFRRYRTKACQSFNDGLLEVGCTYDESSCRMIGLPTGERIAQCAEIDINSKNVAMQIDGEPQMLKSGAHIELRCNQQVWMFQRSEVMSSTNAGVLQSSYKGEARGICVIRSVESSEQGVDKEDVRGDEGCLVIFFFIFWVWCRGKRQFVKISRT